MKILYFDCMSGISGDMTLGALLDLGVELSTIQVAVDSLGLPKPVRFSTETVKRHGFRATKLKIDHEPEDAHRHLKPILKMIDGSSVLTVRQKDLAKRIFTLIGEVEAFVHGSPIEKVHFHEVGAIDSIADIVGAAVAIDSLGVDRIVSSPIPVGTGFIEIAHGRVSVPAPATAEILKNVPLAPSDVEAELATPTGAAIVRVVADEFGPLPPMKIEKIGYGAGARELKEQPNLLRVFLGTIEEHVLSDVIWSLETNLDHIPSETVGYCVDKLFEAGALDVFCTAIQMKKNRPGTLLTVLAELDKIPKLERIIFKETQTLGVRRTPLSRHKLERRAILVDTTFGKIEGKVAVMPDGEECFSPEFESCRKVASERNVSLREVRDAAEKAFRDRPSSP